MFINQIFVAIVLYTLLYNEDLCQGLNAFLCPVGMPRAPIPARLSDGQDRGRALGASPDMPDYVIQSGHAFWRGRGQTCYVPVNLDV